MNNPINPEVAAVEPPAQKTPFQILCEAKVVDFAPCDIREEIVVKMKKLIEYLNESSNREAWGLYDVDTCFVAILLNDSLCVKLIGTDRTSVLANIISDLRTAAVAKCAPNRTVVEINENLKEL